MKREAHLVSRTLGREVSLRDTLHEPRDTNMRIGILGGTFNPVHIGHLAIAEMAMEAFRLKKVIFVPCYLPPHKTIRGLPAAYHRKRMLELAIRGNSRFEISDVEVKRRGKSYTVETLEHFKRVFPKGTRLFFIIGEDSFPFLNTWKNIGRILELTTFIVVNRPGCSPCQSKIPHRIVTMPGIEIASKYLRKRVAKGKTIKYLVPEDVFKYINQHKLYKNRES